MYNTMVPKQVKTQKIQAGVQVSRLEDKDIIFSIGSALEDFILLYFILVRNIEKQKDNQWQQPTTQEITVLVKNLLIPLAIKSREKAYEFENALKQEMFEDLEYVQSLEKKVDALESEKAKFLNEYDLLLQECVSKEIMCSILRSFNSPDEKTEL
ncbi:hypothetical protein Tco_0642560 [Tanacetum coccineum]